MTALPAFVITEVATATRARAASSLPTLSITTNGKAVTVTPTIQSGAVNVVTTVTGESQGDPSLVRLNPDVSFAAFGQAVQAINRHHGDINYLDPYGSLVFDQAVNKGTGSAQTTLAPGNYFALDTAHGNVPPHAEFTVTKATTPAALPKPAATVAAIEFGFTGPSTWHTGSLIRFENDGFLVHMIVGLGVKNAAVAKQLMSELRSGKGNPQKLVTSGPTFGAGPLSPGGMQQMVITAKPGVYVLACFMATQDGREHTRLGMERMIKIVK